MGNDLNNLFYIEKTNQKIKIETIRLYHIRILSTFNVFLYNSLELY
jgi:hypothetical protein